MRESPTRNIAFTILSALAGSPDKEALVCREISLSRRDLIAVVLSRAAMFKGAGVVPGSNVLVFTDRGAAFWIDMLALWATGAVSVPVEPKVTDEHLTEMTRCVDPDFVCGRPDDSPAALTDLVNLGEPIFEQPTRAEVTWWTAIAPVASHSLAAILFTSGTTGLPKGVRVRHEMLVTNAFGTLAVLGIQPSDRLLFAIPFRFISSISHALVTLLSGATLLCEEAPLLPGALIELIRTSRATAFGGAPVQLRFIAQTDAKDLPELRWVMSSGDHLPVAVIEQLRQRFAGLRVNTVYGLTELAGRFCALSPDDLDLRPGSVGRPIPGLALKVLDDDGTACPTGEIGHVYAEGAACFDGYIGNQTATDEALTAHGYRTGDLGSLDEDGYLYLSGRSDSVFKRAGLKLSTLPIADALMASGLFVDVAVMPLADEVQGHVPAVYYVLKPGASFDRGAVQQSLRRSLPVNSLPAVYHEIAQVPRTGSGKIDRRKLAAVIAELG